MPAVRAATLKRTSDAAETVYRLAPDTVRALQALMLARFHVGHVAGAIAIGRQALALAPNEPELLGEFGSRLALTGNWDEGRALLLKALERDPGDTGVYYGYLAFNDFVTGALATPRAGSCAATCGVGR